MGAGVCLIAPHNSVPLATNHFFMHHPTAASSSPSNKQVDSQKRKESAIQPQQPTFSLSKLLNQRPTPPVSGAFTPTSSSGPNNRQKLSPCLIIKTQGNQSPQQQQQAKLSPLAGRIPSPVPSHTNLSSPSSSPCRNMSLPTSSSNQSSVSSSSFAASSAAGSTSRGSNSYPSGPSLSSSTCSSSSLSSASSTSSSSLSSSSMSSSSSSSSMSSSASSSPTMQLGSSSLSGPSTALISNQDWKSAQSGQMVMLTEEERRTLMAEGYPIPQRFPLSKAEERSLKKIRRKIKNKISAQESRRKKKEYMEELEKKVHQMEARLAHLEQENRLLREGAETVKLMVDSSKQPGNLVASLQCETVQPAIQQAATGPLVAYDISRSMAVEHKQIPNEQSQLAETPSAAPVSTSNSAEIAMAMNQREEVSTLAVAGAETSNSQMVGQSYPRRKLSTASALSGQLSAQQASTDDDYFIDDILMSQETQEEAQKLVNDELVANLVEDEESSNEMGAQVNKTACDRSSRADLDQCRVSMPKLVSIKQEDRAEPEAVRLVA